MEQMEGQVLMHQEGTVVSTSVHLTAVRTDNQLNSGVPFSQSNASGRWIHVGVLRVPQRWRPPRLLFSLLLALAVLQVAYGHKARNSDFYELRPG